MIPAVAAESCPGNPNALGTSRTIAVDPVALPRIGTMQYSHSLPLEDHEVALTFDDGPLPPYTDRILETLASECVKVTYFLVGQMAAAYPDAVRRIYNAGHVIGTHSQHHPRHFDAMGLPRVESEVSDGIASVQAAVGDPKAVAPFFRIPGLARSYQVDEYLASKSLAVWSADEDADDWFKRVTPELIVRKAMRRIEAKGHRGVLLLHDIHPGTALALPMLLKELKEHGYRIVQAVPTGERPPSVPERPAALVADAAGGWPRVVTTKAAEDKPLRIAHRKHQKRLAQHDKDAKSTRHAKHIAKADDDAKPAHHRNRIALKNKDETDITATIAKKKRKPQTAEQDKDFSSIWR